jgi:hypothetical protein
MGYSCGGLQCLYIVARTNNKQSIFLSRVEMLALNCRYQVAGFY